MRVYRSTGNCQKWHSVYHLFPACSVFPRNGYIESEIDTTTLLKTEICRMCRRMYERYKHEVVPTLGKQKAVIAKQYL